MCVGVVVIQSIYRLGCLVSRAFIRGDPAHSLGYMVAKNWLIHIYICGILVLLIEIYTCDELLARSSCSLN